MSVDALAELLAAGGVAVLSGAGISTESGIPDYRGETGSRRQSSPMTHQEFERDPRARHRYWARSHVGWRRFAQARPNAAHRAVARLETAGLVDGVITQNVDGLHQAAGSARVIDLHGRLDRVVCLHCGERSSRWDLDARIGSANRDWRPEAVQHQADGDAELTPDALAAFRMVDCDACGGVLKPDVVYFGDSVPSARVHEAAGLVDSAKALVVLGSSLHVFSGRRFVARAVQHGLPVAIVNQGPTRCDADAAVRIDGSLGEVFGAVLRRLSFEPAPA